MKKIIFTFIAILSILVFTLPVRIFAVESSNPQTITTDNHTAQEEAEGKDIWDKLQVKQLECKNLTNDNYEVLGEYFMGQRLGISHESMNNMIRQMMGDEGEKNVHISLGKRLSGCDTSYPFPTQGTKFLPMMGMMGGNWNNNSSGGGGWTMMWNNFSGMMTGGGIFSSLTWLLVIVFLILGIIYFWKQITRKERK